MSCEKCISLGEFGGRDRASLNECKCVFDEKYIKRNVLRYFQFYYMMSSIDAENPPSLKDILRYLRMYSSIEIRNRLTNTTITHVMCEYINGIAQTIPGHLHPWEYLNVGCQDGRMTRSIAQKIGTMTRHVDRRDMRIGKYTLEDYEEFALYGIRNGKISLPFQNEEFRIVTCFTHLHTHSNPRELLEEIFRILRPGGLLIIQEYDCRDWVTAYIYDTVYYMLNECTLDEYSISTYRPRSKWIELITNIGFCHMNPGPSPEWYFDVFQKDAITLHPQN